ncbi:copper resistance CopC family protein [Actinomycetospora sp. CA-101289]|uniref:copper resistance CopC family protein n=1 Tax=Actinomycetospora sp. CA-101289 TaxID=3239893 RepID=UPI003D974614
MPDTLTARAVLRASRPVAVLAAVLLTLATLLFTAGPAAAHDIVSSSDPADGATVSAPPTQVSVTFDQTPQPGLSTLTVVGPDGARREAGPSTAAGNVLTVPVGPLPVAGVYEIGYRIVSSDGHPTSGSLSFTLTTPSPAGTAGPAGSPTPADAAAGSAHGGHQSAPPSPAAGADQDTGSGSVPTWVFALVAVVVIAGAVALVLRRRV